MNVAGSPSAAFTTTVVANEAAAYGCAIQASILAANEASIELHAKCGFRLVGVREKLARKRGEWSDVVLMERRSGLVA